ncbi:MAG: hypothetical protein J0M17_14480 [Planctomycetes bacterium]|nr:hypothetical protein [Planctomycetota bacterium]
MKLTLMGPDDQGCWFLSDATGQDFKIVEKWNDLSQAAKLLGWSPSSNSLTTDELNEEVREFLIQTMSFQAGQAEGIVRSRKKVDIPAAYIS